MSFQQGQILLLDANVIIEAHRTGCWAAIARYFALHTVEKVIEETQTGYQNRDPETLINEASLRSAFTYVADVDDTQRVSFNLAYQHPALDDGERDLSVYALTLTEPVWWINGPDIALLRFAHRAKWIDRLVSLESMVANTKARLRHDLRENYTERWLSVKRTNLLLGRN